MTSIRVAAAARVASAWPACEAPPPLDPLWPSGDCGEPMSHGEASLGVGRGEGSRGVVGGAAWRKTAGGTDQTTSLTVMAFESAEVSA
jgi:hypothetical protein